MNPPSTARVVDIARSALVNAHISFRVIAQKSGRPHTTLYRHLNDAPQGLLLDDFLHIADALGVPPSNLMRRAEDERVDPDAA